MERRVGMEAERNGRSRTHVAFIAGASWSGSTLLEQELAQLDDCISVGESFWIWDENWPHMKCECGEESRDCDFWQTVIDEAYGAEREAVRADVRARSQGLWRHSIVPTLANARSPFDVGAAFAELGALVEPLYRAVTTVSGASTVVDATKAGLWGFALSRVDTIRLRVIHLVRDPSAYLASDSRYRDVPYPLGATRPPRPPMRSLLTWLLLHAEADVLARHDWESVTVLYDDLVRAPGRTAQRVARAIGLEDDVDHIFDGSALVVRRRGHAIGGNPRRPQLGQTRIVRQEPGSPVGVPLLVRTMLLPIAEARYRRYVTISQRARGGLVRSGP